MVHRIAINGPFRYVVLGLVIVFFAGNWLAPDLLDGLTGSSDRSWRLLRTGHVERYERNLTDHWLTAGTGTYKTGAIPVLGGDELVLEFDVDRLEGWVWFRLVQYEWGFWPEQAWSEDIRDDQSGSFRIRVPQAGLYGLELSYVNFAGDVTLDWSVH